MGFFYRLVGPLCIHEENNLKKKNLMVLALILFIASGFGVKYMYFPSPFERFCRLAESTGEGGFDGLERRPRAVEYYGKAIASWVPENGIQKKAKAYAMKARYEDYWAADSDLTESIRLDPNNAALYHTRAIARASTLNSDGAKADYAKAAELGFTQEDAKYGRF